MAPHAEKVCLTDNGERDTWHIKGLHGVDFGIVGKNVQEKAIPKKLLYI
jgi:hypothetical protein